MPVTAQRHNGHVFDEQKPYAWQPYIKPRGLMDKAMFWAKPPPQEPKIPKGIETETDAEADAGAS